jgi:hypothetical protein
MEFKQHYRESMEPETVDKEEEVSPFRNWEIVTDAMDNNLPAY